MHRDVPEAGDSDSYYLRSGTFSSFERTSSPQVVYRRHESVSTIAAKASFLGIVDSVALQILAPVCLQPMS